MPKRTMTFDKILNQMEFNMIMGGNVFNSLKVAKRKKGGKK
jgi:hypothetical protein